MQICSHLYMVTSAREHRVGVNNVKCHSMLYTELCCMLCVVGFIAKYHG